MWTKWKKWKKLLMIVLALVLAVMGVFSLYAGNYYHADLEAVRVMSLDTGYEKMERLDDGSLVFYPEEYDTGIIFYPGGKVEYIAYAALMEQCAQRGILCVLVEMPFNLAVLDANAADGIREQYPQVESWYMAGHSLGGSMAASYAAEQDDFAGLILLAAYSTEDVTDLPTLSIYGSEDGVLNMEKYEQYRSNLSADFEEYIIEGGNHAFFGVYGAQTGDGEATITNQEQIEQTADLIEEFVK